VFLLLLKVDALIRVYLFDSKCLYTVLMLACKDHFVIRQLHYSEFNISVANNALFPSV